MTPFGRISTRAASPTDIPAAVPADQDDPSCCFVGRRRRGPELERAIYDATLGELAQHGLEALTMEGVAAAAKTGKASLYRRWKSKDELLADALTLHSPIDVAVDTGSLRGDLVKLYEHYYGIGNHVMQAAMQEMLGNVRQHLAWTEKVAPERLTARRAKVRALFERAVARGEIAPPADMDLLLDLVPAMVLYR